MISDTNKKAIMATSDSLGRITRLLDEVQSVLRTGQVTAIAIELPPLRALSHDDERPRIEVPYEIGTTFGLWSNAVQDGRERALLKATPVGAVVVTENATWVLLRSELIGNATLSRDLFPEACAAWGHEALERLAAIQREEDDRVHRRGRFHWRNRDSNQDHSNVNKAGG
jgi:hypothetical protein